MKKEIFGLVALALFAGAAQAQYQPYHSPHWAYDGRYQHRYYYPAVGYSVRALPPGYLAVSYGPGRYYFHAGVWYRPAGPAFVVVRPPVGIVVPVLPPAYSVLYVGSQPYYYSNETYYSSIPGGAGYAVVAPPPGAELATVVPPAPPPATSPQPGQAPGSASQNSPGSWYYCESAKGYYPYVSECREGWRPVPAVPPAPR
jgi:hypothetical protein